MAIGMERPEVVLIESRKRAAVPRKGSKRTLRRNGCAGMRMEVKRKWNG